MIAHGLSYVKALSKSRPRPSAVIKQMRPRLGGGCHTQAVEAKLRYNCTTVMITRRKARKVKIGDVFLGSDFPVAIQSMTQTRTENVAATIAQILEAEKEGCDMMRVAVPHLEAAWALKEIKKKIHMPLIADIHFDYRLALEAIKSGADKIRINPGNIGSKEKVLEIIKLAKKYKIAIRIGVNAGSLEQELMEKHGGPTAKALVESALNWIKFFEKHKFTNIVLSVKSSDVLDCVEAYKLLAKKCDYPLHLGITEAGIPPYAAIKSAVGLGALLLEGIGDTVRVSMSAPVAEQIQATKHVLKSLHLYNKEPEIIACPTCGRKQIDVEKLARKLEPELMKIKRPLKVAILGCTVNVVGESMGADYAICGGGKGKCAIFRKGKILKWVTEKNIVGEIIKITKSTK